MYDRDTKVRDAEKEKKEKVNRKSHVYNHLEA